MNNLYLIIGEDKQLLDFYLIKVLDKIGNSDVDKIVIDMNEVTFDKIIDEASMMSMFFSKKVIIVNSFEISSLKDGDIEYLKRYLENINKDSYIILLCKKIDARVKGYKILKDKFNIIDTVCSDSKNDIFNYVSLYIKEKGYKIDNSNLEYFLSKVGNDISNINLELDKLFKDNYDSKIITRDSIDKLVIDIIDNIIYEFTNAFFDKDYSKIERMYDNFKINNITDDYLIASLANSLQIALVIKILENDGKSNLEIASFIGKKEFYVKKMLERLDKYMISDIKEKIRELAIIDREYKSGKSSINKFQKFLFN